MSTTSSNNSIELSSHGFTGENEGQISEREERQSPTPPPSTTNPEYTGSGTVFVGQESPPPPDARLPTAQIYQPRFYSIFERYCSRASEGFTHASATAAADIDLRRPLMAICLQQLIEFTSWARSSEEIELWIKASLDHNQDLRPEVRNGMMMILVYTFASAKAFDPIWLAKGGGDMFGVLQHVEDGLGIISKTSLKIYNDPFHYFNFLKNCCTGLIDIGLIPENERINKPKNKVYSKKADYSKEYRDEMQGFYQLKDKLVKDLESGANAEAAAKVTRISKVWQQCDKSIRGNWFMVASSVLDGTYGASALAIAGGSLPSFAFMPPHNSAAANNSNHSFSGRMQALASNASSSKHARDESSSSDPTYGLLSLAAAAGAFVSVAPSLPLPVPPPLPLSSRPPINKSVSIPVPVPVTAVAHDRPLKLPRTAGPVENGNNGAGSSQLFKMSSSDPVVVSSNSVKGGTSAISAIVNVDSTSSSSATPTTIESFDVLVFEKITAKEWALKKAKVFDIASFMQQLTVAGLVGPVYLVDETTAVTEEEQRTKKVISNAATQRLSSLQSELASRGAVVTSWQLPELPQLKILLEKWHNEPKQHHLSSSANAVHNSGLIACWRNDVSFRSGGTLAYETIAQSGILIRKYPDVGVLQDSWRLLYTDELESAHSPDMTLGQFFGALFPQYKSKLEVPDKQVVVVKCFSRRIGHEALWHPPSAAGEELYQTVGTLDQLALDIISRLDLSQNFHDFIFVTEVH